MWKQLFIEEQSFSSIPDMVITPIDDYEVMYSSNFMVPRIWLANKGKWIGQLFFEPDGKALPPDSMVNNQVNLFYHLEDFQNLIHLLEDEGPMYLLWNGAGAENGIMTSLEQVGT